MPADQEHVGEGVAAGIFEVDHHDVRIMLLDGRDQAGGRGDAHELAIARLAQALLDDRGTHLVGVDDQDP